MNRSCILVVLFSILHGVCVRADTVLSINEIMYHPASNEPGLEWVELRNQMAVDVDASGWALGGAIAYTFPSNSIIRGGAYVVVAISPTTLAATTGLTNVHGPFTGRLGNGGDLIELRNNSGRLMDQVEYGVDGDWPSVPDGSGASLAKRNRDAASAPAASWTFSEQMGGTPGADNFPFSDGQSAERSLLSAEAAWKYKDSGEDLGASWQAVAFNDQSWASGTALTSRTVTGLFNTGVGSDGVALAVGSSDPHYVLTAAAQGAVGANATVMENHSAWLANDATSRWIGVVSSGTTSVNFGTYSFRTRFLLSGFILSTVKLNLVVSVDNTLSDVLLNGASKGLSCSGYSGWNSAMTVEGGFVAGTNSLEFVTVNEGTSVNPHGFRALVSGSGLASSGLLAAGRSTYYFRKSFVFDGDPTLASLRLNPMVGDGAVFYLNGAEVYRQNMPEGTPSYGTRANSIVSTPTYAGLTSISKASLRTGTNVLAVEVHMAAGNTNAALLMAELNVSTVAAPPVTLAMNEAAPGTNTDWWVELCNYGANDISLDGFVLTCRGSTNAEYVFPAGESTLAAGGYAAVSNATLGFHPAPGDRLWLLKPSRLQALDGMVVKKTLRGRYPDGTGSWLWPAVATPGGSNQFSFHKEIVINEIMYHHAVLASTNDLPPKESPEAWIELYNRSAAPVDLTGWQIEGGISYQFGPGRILAPGAYLVVAADAAYMRSLHPALDVVGDFGGRLSGKTDLIRLVDPVGNPANMVRYFDGGRWPEYANGGGSSLELRDVNADNSKAEVWAASDEAGKTGWQSYSYRLVANIPSGNGQPTQWSDFIFGLLSSGECLIDDISVIEAPASSATQIIANGNFESGLTGWRMPGDHRRSRVEVDPSNPANRVLHVIADGPQEHMHNHIETTLVNGRSIVSGQEYQISFRARWLAGNNLLNTRLYFNRCGRTTALPMASLNGTPGARNSRWEANIGPTFSQFQHKPVIPQPSEPVSVSVVADDPKGVTNCQVWWSANGGAWSNATMTALGRGAYAGAIPPYPAGTIVQFYVRAADGQGVAATYPAGGPDSGALYTVADGQANLALAHNVRIILTPDNTATLHALTNVMSNGNLPCTVIYDESRAYYDMSVRLKGSQRGRYSDTRTSFHLNFQPDDLFRGVHPVMLVDRSGAGDSTGNKQEEIVIRHILLHAGKIPGPHPDICRVIAPMRAHTGPAIFAPRHEDDFIETAFANGGQGTEWELELIYYPTTTNSYGYKLPQPDNVVGTDISDLGTNKEFYRYNFIIKNHRDIDDYVPFVNFARALSLSGTQLEQTARQLMDVDEWMRAWAHVTLCGVGDSYTFGNNHNLLMYLRPSDNKMMAFPVDMDFAFTRGASDALVGDQNISKLINLPANLRIFYANILDIIGSTYNSSYITYWANRYDDFCPGQDYSGVPAYVQSRGDYAKSVISSAGGNSAFAVNGAAVLNVSSNYITLSGTAPVTARFIKVNGKDYPIAWSSVSSWTMRVPVSEASNSLAVMAYNLNGQAMTNLTRTVTVNYTGPAVSPLGNVVINEIMYHPAYPEASYVELCNLSTNTAFDLSGWRLNGLDFTFPAGIVIAPRQYLVLAKNAASYLAAYGLSAPLPAATYAGSLQNNGETLTLIKPGLTPDLDLVVDKVRYDSELPWPAGADGTGTSLQLADPAQDNSRAGNWCAPYVPPVYTPEIYIPAQTNSGWRMVSVTGKMGPFNKLMIYMTNAAGGDVYLDDLALVAGTNAGAGDNFIRNGGFELPLVDDPVLTNSFSIPTNYTNTAISSAVKHSGNSSLHLVCSYGSSAIKYLVTQNLSPAPTNGAVCTLSFWYLVSSSAQDLTVRLQANTTLNAYTNVSPVVTPAVYIPPQIVSPATNYLSPGAANTVLTNLPPFPSLWINEVQAENLTGHQDRLGHRGPWVEIYNGGTNSVPLEGLFLSGNYTNLAEWAFPAGAVIESGEFKVIFADGATAESIPAELHTSFALSPGSGSIALSRQVGDLMQVIDYIGYRDVRPDRSYGSYPDGQLFERQEFYRVTPGAPNNNASEPITVRINEWMAANSHTIQNTNHDNRYDDWFELYNPTDKAASLNGCFFLNESASQTLGYAVPSGFVVPAKGFLLVWADGKPELNDTNIDELHVSFKLGQAGEKLLLYAGDDDLIDWIDFGSQYTDMSQGRYPDGSPSIYFLATPTPRGPNSIWANRPPSLDPIPDITAWAGKLIAFAAHATDPESPAQTLTYSFDPVSPEGALIDPASGLFTWTPTLAQVPSTNLIIVRVTDDGTPALSATRSFTVTLVPAVQVGGITVGPSGAISISLNGLAGKRYRIDYKTHLDDAAWTPLAPEAVASSDSLVVPDSSSGQAQRFYRLVLLD